MGTSKPCARRREAKRRYSVPDAGRERMAMSKRPAASAAVASATPPTSLGVTPSAVFVPHPIQDRTDDEMRALADAAVDAVVAALIEG